jgi:pimeloyl-ACP methyl ester carboxylesterase
VNDTTPPAELAYEDVGTGLPLLLLHAFPLDASMWQPQLPVLMSECRCIAPDLRGFGASPITGPYSMDQYADDLAGLLDYLQMERAVVAGLSMGGYIALALWRRHPTRIRALVLADTRAGADTVDGAARRAELITVARQSGTAAVAERQMPGLVGKTTRALRPEIGEDVRGLILRANVEGVVGALEAMMSRPDSTALLGTIDVPTMIVVGEEDVLTPPAEACLMHDAIAGSRLETIERAGHLSNMERPAAFNTVLTEFVGGLLYH